MIGSDKFLERAVQKGIGPHLARMFESGFQSRAAGELAKVDPALGTILGRPLGTVENELPRLLASLR